MLRTFMKSAPVAALTAVLVGFPSPGPAMADTANTTLIYQYDFYGLSASATKVPNTAGVSPYDENTLTIQDATSPAGGSSCYANGVTFDGQPAGTKFWGNSGTGQSSYCESVAGTEPQSGQESLAIDPSQAVGTETSFGYLTQDNPGCANLVDSANITELGRSNGSGSAKAQIKLQTEFCGADTKGSGNNYLQCKMDGSVNDEIVTDPAKLVSGDLYTASCENIPNAGGTSSTIYLRLYNDTTKTTDNTSKAVSGGLGQMDTNLGISAGNKYKMPSFVDNTEQFNGVVNANDYCQGTDGGVTTKDELFNCLDDNLPTS